MTLSLRTKLISSFVIVVLISSSLATWVGMYLIANGIVRQAQDKVRIDLNSAREIYQNNLDKIGDAVRFTSVRLFLAEGIQSGDYRVVKAELAKVKEREAFDILTLTDRRGMVLHRAANPDFYGDSQTDDPLVARVLSTGEGISATEIVYADELAKEDSALVARANIPVAPRADSSSSLHEGEVSGMMIKAAAPVFDAEGELLGVLYGGVLLNRNYIIVDKIKDVVYRGETYRGVNIGAATIFKDDVRVSTYLSLEDGSRAIGTRASAEVYERVVKRGMPWTQRAFVINDWFITAYEPIRSFAGEIIGMLAVGMQERKYSDLRKSTIYMFLGITLGSILVALAVSYVVARGIVRPIRGLLIASEHLAQGDLTHKVDVIARDEIGKLGATFNFMADSLKDRDEQLRQRMQHTVMEAERLATIGQLAAGVAHELNNPLGGILLYSNLLLEKAKEGDTQRDDLQRIVHETERCRKIVRGLLDFSRQTRLEMSVTDMNKVVEKTLDLIATQAVFKNVTVHRVFTDTLPKVLIDIGQMQQVFINILFNAVEAVEKNAVITVSTAIDAAREYVEVIFKDNGPGISQEYIKKIFDPFFTTKPLGKGTGLGLSIAFGIVRKHNGTIEVESEPGAGSAFIVKVPVMSGGEKKK